MSFVSPVDNIEPNEEKDERAQQICAQLLIFTFVKKKACKDLMLDDELRERVRKRLAATGMELVENFYSDYFAIRMRPEIESDVTFDWPTNTRLDRAAVSLLVVLWAKLVLPKRVAQETGENPDETNFDLFPEGKPKTLPVIKVHREALFAEFGSKFGKVNFQRYLGRLRNLGFVTEDRSGNIGEGPMLDLLIDGTQMAMKLKDSVLWELVGQSDNEKAAQGSLDLQASDGVAGDSIGFPAGIDSDIVRETLENTGEPSSLDPEMEEEEGEGEDASAEETELTEETAEGNEEASEESAEEATTEETTEETTDVEEADESPEEEEETSSDEAETADTSEETVETSEDDEEETTHADDHGEDVADMEQD